MLLMSFTSVSPRAGQHLLRSVDFIHTFTYFTMTSPLSPVCPEDMDWSQLYPEFFSDHQSTQKAAQVEFADIGCGYGGLLGMGWSSNPWYFLTIVTLTPVFIILMLTNTNTQPSIVDKGLSVRWYFLGVVFGCSIWGCCWLRTWSRDLAWKVLSLYTQ